MRALIVVAGLLALCACPSLAAAQAPPPDSQFQKVVDRRHPGRADGPRRAARRQASCTSTRSGEVWLHDPTTGLKTLAAKLNVYQHDEEGLQSIALDPNFAQERLGLPVLLTAAEHAASDNPATPTVNEGDAPVRSAPRRTSRRSRATSSCRASSGTGATHRPRVASRRSSRCRSTAASAATSAVTSSSTRTATCSWPPATTRTRSSPTGTRRSTSARAATRRSTRSARRRTPTTCAGRSCASRSARTAGIRSRPGNLFVDGDPLTRPEIYVDGPAQPVPHRVQPRGRASSTSPTTRRTRPRRTRCAGRQARASGRS